jgi:pimeloyl-ACP methyl ester carboxylesterase
VAESFHAMFPGSELVLLPTARHYVQVDEPEEVARQVLTAGGQTGAPGRLHAWRPTPR